MEKRKRYALASGAALLLSLGGAAVLATPAFADAGTTPPAQTQQAGVEDGTNDGEQNDATEAKEANEPAGYEDGTNDGEQNDATESGQEDGTNDGETADDATTATTAAKQTAGHEDGTNDGETNDDAGTGK